MEQAEYEAKRKTHMFLKVPVTLEKEREWSMFGSLALERCQVFLSILNRTAEQNKKL